jgi:hypothetical protein
MMDSEMSSLPWEKNENQKTKAMPAQRHWHKSAKRNNKTNPDPAFAGFFWRLIGTACYHYHACFTD